jgi:hypothetical protein
MSKKIMLFTPSALVSALSFLGALFFCSYLSSGCQ